MLSAGLTRALVGLLLDSEREMTLTLDEVARFGFPADKPSLRHDLANFLCFCEEESAFGIGDTQPLSVLLGPENIGDDRIKLGEQETLRPAGVQRQRVVGNAIFTVVITDVEMSGEVIPDPGLKAAPRKPTEQPELTLTITDGCGVCGVCGTCGLCVICAEINYGVAGAASAALIALGGSASMEYCAPDLADRAINWALSMQGLLRWTERPLSPGRPPQVTGRRDAYYPQHAVIEITDRCNFSCEHCYLAVQQNVGSFMPFDTFATVVDLLSSNGVQVVELSGGECTIHPRFTEILHIACSKFNLVSVLTNGYLLGVPGKVRDAILGCDNVAVQVSIDGIESTHDLFRRHRHSFQRAVEAVRVCAEAGKPTRIATSVSEGTLNEVPELVSLGRKLAPALHAFAPVAPFGRGCNVTESALASAGTSRRLEEALKKAGYSGPGITQAGAPTAAGGVEQIRNCGAGHRTVAVDVNAGVRPCNFGDALDRLGNLLTDDYHEIFSGLRSFQLANAPRPGGVECLECEYFNFCPGCPSKAMSLVPRANAQCHWYERWFETEAPSQVNGADLLGVCGSCRETQVSSRSPAIGDGSMVQERRKADG